MTEDGLGFVDRGDVAHLREHIKSLYDSLSYERRKQADLREQVAVLEEQLAVACQRAQRYRDTLLRLAARADDYSGADVRAQVADALGIGVVELGERLEAGE